MIARICEWLVSRILAATERRPYFHLPGYMHRYWLWDRSDRFSVGTCARVHRILRDDDARALHDHPAANISIILRGRYVEIRPRRQRQQPRLDALPEHQRRREYGPGSIIVRSSRTRHRLELIDGKSCTTIFIMWRRAKATEAEASAIVAEHFWAGKLGRLSDLDIRYRQWGFYLPTGWQFWRGYCNQWSLDCDTADQFALDDPSGANTEAAP